MHGFAVIDVVTDGPSPTHDRIIEIAIAHVDVEGHVTAVWDTLVNPARAIGPRHIRGIRPSDLALAPEFADVAGELCALLEGRVIVAHDTSRPLSALTAELARTGMDHPALGPITLCTLALARRFAGAEGADSAGVALPALSSARSYALAVARLLATLIDGHAEAPVWNEATSLADATSWPGFTASGFSLTPRPRERSIVAG